MFPIQTPRDLLRTPQPKLASWVFPLSSETPPVDNTAPIMSTIAPPGPFAPGEAADNFKILADKAKELETPAAQITRVLSNNSEQNPFQVNSISPRSIPAAPSMPHSI